jgi:hypothetical protein
MATEKVILGIISLLFGIYIYIKEENIFITGAFIILGIFLIQLRKNEDQIEKRRDGKK